MRQIPTGVGELVMAAALLAVGIAFFWQSASLPFGTVGLPGPGFFPFVLGIALSVFALAIAIRSARQHRAGTVQLGHRDVLVVFAALAGVGFAFEPLGAYATLGLFTAALLLIVGRVPLWRAVFSASLGMAAAWAFFNLLLGVQLPAGPF